MIDDWWFIDDWWKNDIAYSLFWYFLRLILFRKMLHVTISSCIKGLPSSLDSERNLYVMISLLDIYQIQWKYFFKDEIIENI